VGEFRAVLFDLDDTLLDHTGASTAALREWIPTFGVAAQDVDTFVALWSELDLRHWPAWRSGEISFDEQKRRRARDFMAALEYPAADDDLDAIFAGYSAAYERHWVAFADAAPALLSAASLGLRTGVLTNGDQDRQTAKLTATGLIATSGPVFASSSLPRGKPYPEAYEEACRRLGVAPHETLMVGDNHELDVVAARSAGLSAVHLDRTSTLPAGVDRITTLTDLEFNVQT